MSDDEKPNDIVIAANERFRKKMWTMAQEGWAKQAAEEAAVAPAPIPTPALVLLQGGPDSTRESLDQKPKRARPAQRNNRPDMEAKRARRIKKLHADLKPQLASEQLEPGGGQDAAELEILTAKLRMKNPGLANKQARLLDILGNDIDPEALLKELGLLPFDKDKA